MDYVTRQFIVLAQKLRDEIRKSHESIHHDFGHLIEGVKNLKDSLDTKQQAQVKSSETAIVSISEPGAQIPVRIEKNASKTKPEWIWAITKGILEVAVAFAVDIRLGGGSTNWRLRRSGTGEHFSHC
jgi:hypothetical protein